MAGDHISRCESELVRESLEGSLPAFEQLVYRYEQRIYGFVFQSCGNSGDASEITQDTFVRAFNALPQFNPRYTFASWLFAIARRKCIDFHRARRPAAQHEIPEVPDFNDPLVLICEQEERRSLWRLARDKLSSTQFDVLWLKYAEGMDVTEIARALCKTKTHVKVLLFRARKILARELANDVTDIGLRRVRSHSAKQPTAVISPIVI